MRKATMIEAGYCILQDQSPDGLAKKVGESMGKGWGLAGGPFVIPIQMPAIPGVATAQVGVIWNQALYQVIERELDEEELEKIRSAAAEAEKKSLIVT